jgi:hypothetical protein
MAPLKSHQYKAFSQETIYLQQKGVCDGRDTYRAMDRLCGRAGSTGTGSGGGIVQIDLSIAYLVIGCAAVLSLLALSIMLLFIRGMRLLGIIGLVDALIVPILLVQVLVAGTMHGLVQATYLLIALDVFGFMQIMSRRSRRLGIRW